MPVPWMVWDLLTPGPYKPFFLSFGIFFSGNFLFFNDEGCRFGVQQFSGVYIPWCS